MDYIILFLMIISVILLFRVAISDSVEKTKWRNEKEEIFAHLRANENMLKERNDLILKELSTLENRNADTEKKYNHIVNDLSGSLKQYAEELIKDANENIEALKIHCEAIRSAIDSMQNNVNSNFNNKKG